MNSPPPPPQPEFKITNSEFKCAPPANRPSGCIINIGLASCFISGRRRQVQAGRCRALASERALFLLCIKRNDLARCVCNLHSLPRPSLAGRDRLHSAAAAAAAEGATSKVVVLLAPLARPAGRTLVRPLVQSSAAAAAANARKSSRGTKRGAANCCDDSMLNWIHSEASRERRRRRRRVACGQLVVGALTRLLISFFITITFISSLHQRRRQRLRGAAASQRRVDCSIRVVSSSRCRRQGLAPN